MPAIQQNIRQNIRPSKCILVSPWAALDHTAPSVTKYKDVDIIVKKAGDNWAWKWRRDHIDEFTDPVTISPAEWRKYLPPTLIVSGETEMLYDDIQRLCKNMRAVFPDVGCGG